MLLYYIMPIERIFFNCGSSVPIIDLVQMVLLKLLLLSEFLNFKSTGFITIISQVKIFIKLYFAIIFLSLFSSYLRLKFNTTTCTRMA